MGNQNKNLVVGVLNRRRMETDLSCVTYCYVSVRWPRRSWYQRGRAEAVLATSPGCSKTRRRGEFWCSNLAQRWPFKAERGVQHGHCPVQTRQPRELYPGGQCQAGTAKASRWQRQSDRTCWLPPTLLPFSSGQMRRTCLQVQDFGGMCQSRRRLTVKHPSRPDFCLGCCNVE